jgi:hypothetical protein
VVCLDQFGLPAFTSCQRTGCVDPATCPPPPECGFERGPNGEVCRTCLVEADQSSEQRCIVETNLVCTQVDGVGDPNAPSTCLACKDAVSGIDVYQRCGNVAPPTCQPSTNDEGQACEVCSDPVTAELVYATCEGQTCYSLGDFHLDGATGAPLALDGAPAVATCAECAAGTDRAPVPGGDVRAMCSLREGCAAIDLASPGLACPGAVLFRLAPLLCGNPWETAGYDAGIQLPGSSYEAMEILSFALESAGIGLFAVADVDTGAAPGCSNDCTCLRGDELTVAVRPADAASVREVFDAVIVPCASDQDCGSGTCRLDGACTQ